MKKILNLLFIVFTTIQYAQCTIYPTSLTCEYLKNPPVIDVRNPRLSWINIAEENERGQSQTGWQVRVASSKEMLSNPDLWDSGKTESEQSNNIKYQGKNLQSRQECWWQVRVWDREGNMSEWSEPAMWRMGLLQPSEWKAQWIGVPWQGEEAFPRPSNPNAFPEELPPPAPLLRKEFSINKKVKKAVAFVTGLGYFELYLNGKKVGDDVLVPNQTNYGKRPEIEDALIALDDNFREYKVMYLAYDIKDQLVNGDNAIGSILGNGFYNPAKFWTSGYGTPRFLSQIYITYEDGTEDIIISDESWKVSKSPILMDMVYYGEHYDARKEQPGWCSVNFDDSQWQGAVIKNAPYGKLVAHMAYPDKVTKKIEPVSIEKTWEGKYRVDFGVEISGWLKLNDVTGPEGHKVEIKYISNTYSGDNSYIFKGDGQESYSARFNWFVFHSVEISNWPGELKKENLTAEAVNTYTEESAEFITSNQLFNDINKIWKRSQLDNMHGGIASDCPHRERSGYTGDGQVACITVMHNFDAKAFYRKWIRDMLDAQNVTTGYVPNGAPWQPGCGGGVGWGAAICIMPWEFYLHYGDVDMLQENYEGMTEYIRYMKTWVDKDGIMFSQRTGKNGEIVRWYNLGEWVYPADAIPDDMVHTFYFWRCADLTAKAAKVLNKEKEAKQYEKLANKTKQAFWAKFYDEENGTYGNGGGNVLALEMGVPNDQYEKVVAALKTNIKKNKGHLDTGIFGTQFFFEVLSKNGMHELAYEAMNKRTEPSYGHWLELGTTTSREHWNQGGSHNHPMFGGGLVWFYRQLAGMNVDPENPGYRHIIFKPQPVDEVDFVTYSNNTVFGKAGITWRKNENNLSMDITVPVGCNATVLIPSGDIDSLKENNLSIDQSEAVKLVSVSEEIITVEVKSGNYHFQVNN